MDEDGTVDLPVKNGKWFDHMTMGKNIMKYDIAVIGGGPAGYTAAIVAGMIHSGEFTITDIKKEMFAAGVPTRMNY